MVHTDFQDGGQSLVVLRIARLFSRFIENRTTIYSKFYKERFPESCPVSTVQFMAVVRVEEPKESGGHGVCSDGTILSGSCRRVLW